MATDGTAKARLDIIIIGAGLSGLSAAVSCAQAGHNVLVLEGARELAEVCTWMRSHWQRDFKRLIYS